VTYTQYIAIVALWDNLRDYARGGAGTEFCSVRREASFFLILLRSWRESGFWAR